MQQLVKGTMVLMTLFLVLNFRTSVNQTPNELVGNWETKSTPITFRTKIRWMKYSFAKSNTILNLKINADNTVSGSIGNAKFKNVKMTKNKGNSAVNGISYIIACGALDQICDEDSPELKTIELWLIPMKEKGILKAEIRLIEGWDTFPMGEAIFYLQK